MLEQGIQLMSAHDHRRQFHSFKDNASITASGALNAFETRNMTGCVVMVKATSVAGTPNYTLSLQTSFEDVDATYKAVNAVAHPNFAAINDEIWHVYQVNFANCMNYARFYITLNGGDGGDDKFYFKTCFLYGDFTQTSDITLEGDITATGMALETTQQLVLGSLLSDTKSYNIVQMTYVSGGAADGEVSTVTYKNGGTTIYTLTLGYNAVSGKLETVTRS